jgi:hypothetical protein
MRVASD